MRRKRPWTARLA
ncbi:hypothetical protein GBAR_LOCUS22494 [Geodia barretti]|uniref:Uncharacterized protein n=1 Tax=Geodia barretti TaxID=519541 RepID=A0AA35T4S9_GEOBA|nr:hypothetical protein GBAR_LOCUS22494 [Geodia barretti]